MTSRLSVTLDGKPVYLYEFLQGRYEDTRYFLYVHQEQLSRPEILKRIREAAKGLPEEIDYDYTAEPRMPDLFERALTLVGFMPVDDLVPLGMWLRGSSLVTERDYFEDCLKREEER